MDGWIKMWHYGRFKLDPYSDNIAVVIKPVFEIQVCDERGHSVISHILKKSNDPKDSKWFAQDRNGGLWEVDMQVSAHNAPPVRLYSCHAGPVCSVAVSPRSATLASLAVNGVMHIYKLDTGKLTAVKEFDLGGTKLYWLLLDEEVIAIGFVDGSVKITSVTEDGTSITMKQETKPHKGQITAICANSEKTVLVTGSEDKTVFVYNLQPSALLTPVGYIQLEAPVRGLRWNPSQGGVLLVCCISSLSEILVPEEGFTGTSYQLHVPLTTIIPALEEGIIIDDLICAVYSQDKSIYLVNNTGVYEYNWETKCLLNKVTLEEPISAAYITDDGCTWYLGLECGKVRCLVKETNDWLGRAYEDISLHDTEYGKITDIAVSFHFKFFVDCGMDGNIFVFRLETKTGSYSEALMEKTTPHIVPKSDEVMEEEPGVSLEDAKKDAVLREKMAVAMMKKVRVQRQLAALRAKYCELLKRLTI